MFLDLRQTESLSFDVELDASVQVGKEASTCHLLIPYAMSAWLVGFRRRLAKVKVGVSTLNIELWEGYFIPHYFVISPGLHGAMFTSQT